jgi:polyketide synthase PksN
VSENGKFIIPLSAKTAEQLQQKAADLLDFISKRDRHIDLWDMAYTLQVGREAMEERLGFLVGSIPELAEKLSAYISGEGAGESIYQGRVRDNKEAMSLLRRDADLRETVVDKFIAQRKLSKLLDLWVRDLEFDWNRLYGENRPQRIHLPTYPFAKERYWIDTPQIVQEKRTGVVSSALHPLLHRNTSNFSQQSYSSAFSGDEFFLEHDQADGTKVLSAAAYLEMARAAVAHATGSPSEASIVEFQDIVWGQPFAVGKEKEVTIALFADVNEGADFEIYSKNNEQEKVHCQGRVVVGRKSAPTKLDIPQLEEQLGREGANQLLVQVSLADIPANDVSEYVVHPSLVHDVLQACAGLKTNFSQFAARRLSGLRYLRVISAGTRATTAWVRYSPGSEREEERIALDIELCDREGNVSAEIRGLSLQHLPVSSGQPASAWSIPVSQHDLHEPERVTSHVQLQHELKESLARALFLKTSDIQVDKPFIELGLDSIVGVEWINEVNKKYNVKIAATKVYDYPNIAELASYLKKEVGKNSCPAPREKPSAPPTKPARLLVSAYPSLKRKTRAKQIIQRGHAAATGRIAVIGMSGRYPQANNLEQFWENLAGGKNSVTEIAPSRWDVSKYYDPDPKKEDKTYCKWMGMLDDVECFDPLFFRISPAEAKNMDPQHRLFLEESYKAFENAGYSGKALSNKKCGVYLGLIGTEYSALVSNSVDLTGNNPAIGAARVAYFLNLKGPAISIDTACSASLVAIHLACQGLLNHETDMALAGGASVYLHPETFLGMCRAGMLSPDGQCKTFDNSANGFVPGEGVGAVVLKRLEDAERDKDFIYGVILGSGINQDGKTNGITAPSVNGQIELGREVYSKYGIDPETISYVETHGTGTKLGDPIELEALATVFKEKTAKKNYCGLGSVKSNIGHTSGAAGVASVQKVLLCMKHRTLVPSLNVTKETSLFDFKNSPFYISKETRRWKVAPGSLRRAAVSSFGFSGTNAHLVIEEYLPPALGEQTIAVGNLDGGVIIPLSARTPEQLHQRVQDLLKFIRSEDPAGSMDLASMSYTLLMGRDAMDERLGFIVSSVDQLAEKLEAYVRGDRDLENACRGKVERSSDGIPLLSQQEEMVEVIDGCIARKDFPALMDLWVRGLEWDWNTLYGEVKPRRISLPTYPFARKRYWVDTTINGQLAEARTVAEMLHPLLHRNISVLGQQSYSSTFGGEESFLVRHHVDGDAGQKVLPAVAYLEMARVAVEKAVPTPHQSIHLELHKIACGRPTVARKDRQVNVTLFRKSQEQADFEIYSVGQGPENLAEEIIHCQGHAVFNHKSVPAKLDIENLKGAMRRGRVAPDSEAIGSIYLGDGQLLAQLHLPTGVEASLNDYVLHPSLMDAALQGAIGLMDDLTRGPRHLSLPFALDTVRIESACTKEMFAWMRYAHDSHTQDSFIKLDIDLCDRQGKVCVQMRGVAYEQVLLSDVKPVFEITTSSITLKQPPVIALERNDITLVDPQSETFTRSTAEKPTAISLQ